MLQNILGTIVFAFALFFTYLGWHWMEGDVLGAVMGFMLVAAPGFYYVYAVFPKQQARRKALREDGGQ